MKRPQKSIVRRTPNQTTKKRRVTLKSIAEYSGKSTAFQDRWDRAAHAVTKMRSEKLSLTQAAKEYGLDPRTVIKLGKSALRKASNGRYVAKKSDRLLRVLSIPTVHGRQSFGIADSRIASTVGQYSAAVGRYLQTGDSFELDKFQGMTIIDADGNAIPLLTNREVLKRLGRAGEVSYESLYGRTA